MRLVITGTPGTGKTTVAVGISRRISIPYIDVNRYLINAGLAKPQGGSYVIEDPDEAYSVLNRFLASFESYVADCLPVNLVSPDVVDWVIVLRLDPRILVGRLSARGWGCRKVAENVMAELVGSSLSMAMEAVGSSKVIELDVTGLDVDSAVDLSISIASP